MGRRKRRGPVRKPGRLITCVLHTQKRHITCWPLHTVKGGAVHAQSVVNCVPDQSACMVPKLRIGTRHRNVETTGIFSKRL